MPNKLITVCVCTYERYALLKSLLSRLSQQSIGISRFALLVVDNTPEPNRQFISPGAACGIDLKVVYSSPPGLSRARNVGIDHCTTPLIAFVDDDAEPDSRWLEELVRGFEVYHPQGGAVGGPIRAIWPVSRPSWIPREYESALTILDHGNRDFELPHGEYLYGTNIAFRLELLRKCGGFDTAIGRRGQSLLSGEEIVMQDMLREKGATIVYIAKALVSHYVHSDRLSREWFRRRFAWQGVSEAADSGQGHSSHWSETELHCITSDGNRYQGILEIFKDTDDPGEFRDQLRAIRSLITQVLVRGKGIMAANAAQQTKQEAQDYEAVGAVVVSDDIRYRVHATSIPLGVQRIFIEAPNSHGYLYGLYGDLAKSCYVEYPANPWSHAVEDRAMCEYFFTDVFRSASQSRAMVILLTIDPFIFGTYPDTIACLIKRFSVPTAGIIHKIGFGESQKRGFRLLSEACHRVLSFVNDGGDFAARLGVKNLSFVHHHDVHGRWRPNVTATLRQSLGIPMDRIVIGFLGEVREGKGVEFLRDAIPTFGRDLCERVAFVFCGRGTKTVRDQLIEACTAGGVLAVVDIRESSDGYRILSEVEMDGYISLADALVLPYTGDQGRAMSGVMPSFVVDGKPVLATDRSYVGDLVRRYRLGEVFVYGDRASFGQAVEAVVRKGVASYCKSDAYADYRNRCLSNAVLDEVDAALKVHGV